MLDGLRSPLLQAVESLLKLIVPFVVRLVNLEFEQIVRFEMVLDEFLELVQLIIILLVGGFDSLDLFLHLLDFGVDLLRDFQ